MKYVALCVTGLALVGVTAFILSHGAQDTARRSQRTDENALLQDAVADLRDDLAGLSDLRQEKVVLWDEVRAPRDTATDLDGGEPIDAAPIETSTTRPKLDHLLGMSRKNVERLLGKGEVVRTYQSREQSNGLFPTTSREGIRRTNVIVRYPDIMLRYESGWLAEFGSQIK